MEQDFTFRLSNGLSVPSPGFGTYRAAGEDGAALRAAIACGYRHFDTASYYGTESALGLAVAESGLKRGAFFLSSKVWKTEMGYDNTLRALDASLARLGTDYLDLYLIHWPRPRLSDPDWAALDRETWRAMERLYEEGRVRAIGVCNFLPRHLEPLLARAQIPPMVDQLEFHPGYLQRDTLAFCARQEILVEAWSPLGRARLLDHPLLGALAARHDVSVARLCLRFALQMGVLPIPKSADPLRMAENRDLLSFSLSPEEMAALEALPQAGWSGEHPDRERVPAQNGRRPEDGT